MYWENWLKLGKASLIIAGFFLIIAIILELLKNTLSYAGGLGFVVFGIAGYFVIFGFISWIYGKHKEVSDYAPFSDNVLHWDSMGLKYARDGRFENALECFTNSLEIDPNYKYGWNNKGLALANMGKYEEAIECFDTALEIDQKFPDALYNKKLVLNKMRE